MIPPIEDVTECKELSATGASGEALDSANCMCDNCLTEYGACIVNPACQMVVRCVAEQGCVGMAGVTDPVCSVVINDAAGIDPNVTGLLLPVSTCSETNECQGPVPADAGTTDAGSPDAG